MDFSSFTKDDFIELIENRDHTDTRTLFHQADAVRRSVYGTDVYIRGLIEFSSFCKNDCYYCGIRCGNRSAIRFRLTEDQILACCRHAYALGIRTFVLQGGEDPGFPDDDLCRIVSRIKEQYPNAAVTLSVGERTPAVYREFRRAGADRYLLRHETANPLHYQKLHPPYLSLENRKACLYTLKELGFQTGAGFMVGSPYQTSETLAEDLLFLKELSPEMVGIGPFIPHKDSIFVHHPAGSVDLTVFLLAVIRLLLPEVLLPATTALGTLSPSGREMAFRAGANVVMPNISPPNAREAYNLYDNKLHTGAESAEGLQLLQKQIESCGYTMCLDAGNHKNFQGIANS